MTAPETRAVLDALEAAGGPDCARFVGGCVRNTLMGRGADDVDIATVLTPQQVIAALQRAGLRAVPTGVEHGTVTAIADHHPFEITTLRRDVETDGRRAVVAFSTDWAEDAARRDFRLNALYADREGRLHDYAGGGVEDALAGRIVFVGDAETRIREDYLRILRFFRFFAWYGRGEPDAVGLAACAALAKGIDTLSAERISKELLKLLSAPDPRTAVRLMVETGVWTAAVPVEANLARFEAMVSIDPDPELRLSALLPDDPELDASLAENLRMSNAQRDRLVAALPSGPAVNLDMSEPAARAAIYRLGTRTFTDRVKRAWAESPQDSRPAQALLDLAASWNAPRFPLGGADAKAAGVPHGPAVGRLLRQTEDWWVEHDFPEDGARERLEALAREAAA
ncbi:CCA tRNA nucleotidyltransferase [Caulobacter sp. 17J65-9]|uniref:CCA tRNA nucleotidyltransferase n=1 Tax=Caulobacter sp. 17J65-9 TaxID=2709382 RepID=UPI0013C9D8AF|nr:CCA tRNA nucleotidyltransferase [Caulobacter sp. 17J65-9]NEX93163.1 CCA tRNA nucleotidyltransferase [Caulobacter sp. 17J65-9]